MSDPQVNKRKGITFGRIVSTVGAASILEAPFPTMRTLRWVPQMFSAELENTENGGNGIDLVVTQEVLLAANRHAAQTLEREVGGFLLGNRYRCPNTNRNYVIIDQYIEADYTEGTEVSLNFTNESWAQLNDQLSGKFMGKLLVGWYHSHPRMNVFLSAHDVTIHETRFQEPWRTALVLEPAKHMGGFFCWQDGKLDPHNYVEFYELLEGESRESVVAWTNYVGVDPKNDSPPVLKKLNTRTAQNVLVAGAPLDKDGGHLEAAAAVRLPPKVSGVIPPSWTSGIRLWIGIGVIAILSFIAVFAASRYLWSGADTAEAMKEKSNQPVAGPPRPDANPLDSIQVDRRGSPKLNPETGRFSVTLQVSQLAAEIVQEVEKNTTISIDEHIADAVFPATGTDGFSINASTNLDDAKILMLKRGRPQTVKVISSFKYADGPANVVEMSLTLDPIKDTGAPREGRKEIEMSVRTETKKKKPTRTSDNRDTGKDDPQQTRTAGVGQPDNNRQESGDNKKERNDTSEAGSKKDTRTNKNKGQSDSTLDGLKEKLEDVANKVRGKRG